MNNETLRCQEQSRMAASGINDIHLFIYGGRDRDYVPVKLGPTAPVGVPNCSDVPEAKKWNTPCRDESGILVDPYEKHKEN